MPILFLTGDWKIAHVSNHFYSVVESSFIIKLLLRPGQEEVIALKNCQRKIPTNILNNPIT